MSLAINKTKKTDAVRKHDEQPKEEQYAVSVTLAIVLEVMEVESNQKSKETKNGSVEAYVHKSIFVYVNHLARGTQGDDRVEGHESKLGPVVPVLACRNGFDFKQGGNLNDTHEYDEGRDDVQKSSLREAGSEIIVVRDRSPAFGVTAEAVKRGGRDGEVKRTEQAALKCFLHY